MENSNLILRQWQLVRGGGEGYSEEEIGRKNATYTHVQYLYYIYSKYLWFIVLSGLCEINN